MQGYKTYTLQGPGQSLNVCVVIHIIVVHKPDIQLFSHAPRIFVFYTCHCYNNDIWDYCSYTQPKYKIDAELPFCNLIVLPAVIIIINPRRACAARVTVVVLCVCLSVHYRLPYEAAYERYQQLQYYMDMKKNVAILLKRLHSRDIT